MRHARSHDPLEEDARAITLAGHVQGVGFRPFVYRLADEHGITGWVQNRCGEVYVVACGPRARLSQFCDDLVSRAPPLSRPRIVKQQPHTVERFADFQIVESASDSAAQVFLPPDYFMCDDCCRELHDPKDRRYQYPFINCTQCGPRYTLIESLPYDRPNTSMAEFPLCPACDKEYRNPADRRFHAEPVACQVCGPALEFVTDKERTRHAALDAALRYLRDGRILAIKGIGGYHLVCDAQNGAAIATLRHRKHRPDKPLAVMFPNRGEDGLASVRRYAKPDEAESELLRSPLRPIVLVEKSNTAELARNIAPGLAEIGVFLPYSPLHELILDALDRPLVATSGNISGEPVLIDNAQAEADLGGIADGFLHHNRPILRPADDSVYRKSAGSLRPIRVGRGAAPVEFTLPWRQSRPTLAVGGHTKVTIALGWHDRVVVSPHIGDMHSPKSLATLERLSGDLQSLYGVTAERLVCDAHSGYTTHRWAQQQTGMPVTTVWHHHAHASALVAEGQMSGPSLVFVWDGVGLGQDGTLWGGEAFQGTVGDWQRVASLRPFRLPGGERAGREPWRSAAALLWECGQAWADCPDSSGLAATAWQQQLNCPTTSAAGRLFDAAAALVLDTHCVSHEAGAPMQLEAVCRQRRAPVELPLKKETDGIWRSDWEALLPMLQDDRVSPGIRAETFHSSMAHAVLAQARAVRNDSGIRQVGLSGGVFQNRILSDEVADLLQRDDFDVYLPERLPCNDAALCVGQIAEATVSPLRAAS